MRFLMMSGTVAVPMEQLVESAMELVRHMTPFERSQLLMLMQTTVPEWRASEPEELEVRKVPFVSADSDLFRLCPDKS